MGLWVGSPAQGLSKVAVGALQKPIAVSFRQWDYAGRILPVMAQSGVLTSASYGGSYYLSVPFTVSTAVAAAGASLFSFKWLNPLLSCVVWRARFHYVGSIIATAAQQIDMGIYVARGWTTNDSGGTAISITANNQKKRQQMANSAFSLGTTLGGDIRYRTTGALTAGTRTLDSQSIAFKSTYAPIANPSLMVCSDTSSALFDAENEGPLVFAANEGLCFNNVTAYANIHTVMYVAEVLWSELPLGTI